MFELEPLSLGDSLPTASGPHGYDGKWSHGFCTSHLGVSTTEFMLSYSSCLLMSGVPQVARHRTPCVQPCTL